jgi:hypothetical protein
VTKDLTQHHRIEDDDARTIAKLHSILREVSGAAGDRFTGVGLIVCDSPDSLPILPLRAWSKASSKIDLIRLLAEISVPESEYHDGFHILSSEWKLIRISQYFSPPIIRHAQIDRTRRFGGRYLAALFGSTIHGVQLSGIASRGFGIAVFRDGSERTFEAMR